MTAKLWLLLSSARAAIQINAYPPCWLWPCSGGLEILFGNQKQLQVEVPDSNGQVWQWLHCPAAQLLRNSTSLPPQLFFACCS